ncbi:unnamed protein product [Cuscuta europaea]|uniref:RRM domain-containing protein n=1 Tax=Cuscuta europaea TaxID=41803 RepID=A0A9P1EQ71_CUSEU|nr:unnamed protein product [Cuscuta europaea]
MAKKSKKPHDDDNNGGLLNSDPNPNSSSIFETLFGEDLVNAATSSIFSEDNPFRRKSFGSSRPNQLAEIGLGVTASRVSDSDSKSRKEEKKEKKEKKGEERTVLRVDNEDEEQDGNGSGVKLKNFEPIKFDDNDNKNKKRKRDNIETEYEVKLYGLDEAEKEDSASGKVGEKRKKMDNPEDMMVSKEGFDDESKLLRTIFVGNIPLKLKKKTLSKEFSKFGEIESIRFRSVPISDSKVPRKGAVIMKQLNENADGVHAYIVYKTEESAQASLAHNMTVVGGNHIRVDRACPPRKKMKGDSAPLYDNKRTLFVGNLPFDVKDEEIYQLFCGIKNLDTSLEAVRVIRDPNTLMGKGVAYVVFKTKEDASVVSKKHLKLRDRELRLSHAKANITPYKRKNSNDNSDNPCPTKLRSPGSYEDRTRNAPLSYQGMKANKSFTGCQKKLIRPKTGEQPKFKHKLDIWKTHTERTTKRPAVAARKAKALESGGGGDGGPLGQGRGTKRKPDNRTPLSSGRNTKTRKFG